MDACEFFVLHRLLAFPVVDEQKRVIGVIDVSQFTTEMIDLGGDTAPPVDDVFESIGVRVAQVKGASPVRAFRFRFPWLTATKVPELLLFTPHGDQVITPDGETVSLRGDALAADIARRCGEPVELMELRHGMFDDATLSLINGLTR